MKKYYLHTGTEQLGPFDIEELKSKNIQKDTPIWYEGLTEWTTAEKIIDLKEVFNVKTPPPFIKEQTPPPINKETENTEPKVAVSVTVPQKKKTNYGWLIILIVVLVVVAIVGRTLIVEFENRNNGSDYSEESYEETYEEKVMTVEEIERSKPTTFLSADGTYEDNFLRTKIKIHGLIKNSATVATYKDARIRVTFYSKTKTELGSKDYMVYEVFPPNSEVPFELKIEAYKDVKTIGWEVVAATVN